MLNLSGKWLKDAGERILWTAIEAGAAAGVVYATDLHWAYAPALVTIFSMVKTVAAHFVGDSDTAAMSGK